MPLYEEKFLCPFAIRFSQARIRPTFQDGRLVERSMGQVDAVPWPLGSDAEYDVLLSAPFPPIEIIRWVPKLREEDGRTLVDEDGTTILGEACWFTFDNRRLYCLQAAAAKQWPRRAAGIVHVMHDLPLSRCTPRKFRTTDLGCSVKISRRHDSVPRATWCWAEATDSSSASGPLSEAAKSALDSVNKDARKEEWSELLDVPEDLNSLIGKSLSTTSTAPLPGTAINGHSRPCIEAGESAEHAMLAPSSNALATGTRADYDVGSNSSSIPWPGQSTRAGMAVSSSGSCNSGAGTRSTQTVQSSAQGAGTRSTQTLQSSAHDRPGQHEAGATAGQTSPQSFAAVATEPPFGTATSLMAPLSAASAQPTGPLFPPLGPLLSEDIQPTSLLAGQQMLPSAPSTGDDDDEENCVQS
eukprot:CAMPEP_0172715520 /NCGR_PEP_ID=MMETSP1074-20121228/67593_1 /TAXON_ID=2916 /ORGANISM="Ceratium fusus, Strain PA161109" /LENGTH=411 /DNA_ID=CAMNT_0013540105 /DNA_START=115 /DNA_END=1350 /DNA_ORIENTATION=+